MICSVYLLTNPNLFEAVAIFSFTACFVRDPHLRAAGNPDNLL